jgi:hypothetical protein
MDTVFISAETYSYIGGSLDTGNETVNESLQNLAARGRVTGCVCSKIAQNVAQADF